MPDSLNREPHGSTSQRRLRPAAGLARRWSIYDFFIYATASSLLFPQLFFPSDNPGVAIVASLATFGVGYVQPV